MKCNAFYEDQCGTCFVDSEGTNILNAPRTAITIRTSSYTPKNKNHKQRKQSKQ